LKQITILVPIFNEGENLRKLYAELEKETSKLEQYRFEYLFVDDGSTDRSLQTARELARNDSKITVIELSRNFGKEIALTAGIDMLNCHAVIMMDADLQHPPSHIPQLIALWEKGFDIVAGRRISIESQPFLRRIGSSIFYKLLNSISNVEIMAQSTDFRLLDRVVIESLQSFTERNRMVRGIIDWMGFRKTYFDFEAPERFAGKSVYSYTKLFGLAMNSFMSFSLLPLKIGGYLGLFITFLSTILIFLMTLDRLFFHLGNFTNLSFVLVANTFFVGVILIALGLIALYVGNINNEVVGRPLYLIRRTVQRGYQADYRSQKVVDGGPE
jgi:polyisoprenyl-phosphate glycosyltransferase